MKKRSDLKTSPKTIKLIWGIAAAPFIILFLMLLLASVGAFGHMPSFEELENPKSNLATEIYSEDGKVLGTFFIQNRSYVQYAELLPQDSTAHIELDGYKIPPIVAALISTEDIRFRSHSGIDIPSLVRVAVKTVMMQNISQGGGSTITQQLAKNLFPRDTTRYNYRSARMAKLVTSKLKEWITALKLEYNYTKEEIAAMYLNTVEYGSNSFGIKSASQTFFNKSPNELNIQEAAVLVGVVNAPTRYSPVRNPKNAMTRRNLVLSRMADAGAITKSQSDSISAIPITLNYMPISHNAGSATYFREMLRVAMNKKEPTRNQFYNKWDYEQALIEYNTDPIYGWCHKNKKADGTSYNIYRDGLKIYTTINSRLQDYAEQALLKQLTNEIQPRMESQYRRTKNTFIDASSEQVNKIMNHAIRYSDRYRAMANSGVSKKEILESFNVKTAMKVFTYKGVRDTIITPKDSILHHKRIMRASFVAQEPRSGAIKAYIGGPNFRYFKYDMAKQGKRQAGSTIKPFVYTFAIDHLGLTPCSPVPNLPVTIETANGTPWSPKESVNVEQLGEINPLKWGLSKSRNNYSAWIMKQAKQPAAVADFINNMGVNSYIDPVPALCLGTAETNVYEMVGAYSTFANKGVHNDPIFVTRIEDSHGNLISSFTPKSQDAISEGTAYTMLTMLQDVVDKGTAGRINWQYGFRDVEIGGKTGTSNKNRDAWFMCVTPKLVVGTWVGAEDQLTRLQSQGEASVMALPIVGDFLTRVYNDTTLDISRDDRFDRPAIVPNYDCDDINDSSDGEEYLITEEDNSYFD